VSICGVILGGDFFGEPPKSLSVTHGWLASYGYSWLKFWQFILDGFFGLATSLF